MNPGRDDTFTREGSISVAYNWTTGESIGRFLTSLRDDRKILGRECPRCGKVYVPPVDLCPPCFTPTEAWREVGPGGIITALTRVRVPVPYQPEDPLVLARIRLDGSDTDLVHMLGGKGAGEVEVGERVVAVFRGQRTGSVLDIEHFSPPGENKPPPAAAAGPDKAVSYIEGTLDVPYRYSYGKLYTRFARELRDNRRLMGIRCPRCRNVFIPPEPFCSLCFADTCDWVEVQDRGTVRSFTVVHLPFPGQPTEPPYAWALIDLDGADVIFTHVIGEIPPEEVQTGMRVEAVWNDTRRGDLHDIRHFRPIGLTPSKDPI